MSSSQSSRFGKYELLDRIAAGGMAEIFRARYEPAPGVSKQVVIKRILPHYAENKNFIAMFTNEARIVMGLSHGNIAQVFDFGAIDGDYFLAMELVDGHPLNAVARRARELGIPVLPPQFAAFVTAEMLKGLHYAHTRLDERGRPLHIVHRDVSPQNVLLGFEGQAKLVDFGIARARHLSSGETAANAVKGKYTYFSPEQARAKELDARTDVFASGIVLYELLTGQLPFQGRLMDVLAKIVRGQFLRPRQLNPRIPPELERIVLKAMATEQSQRYASAEAFQVDLNRFLATNFPDFTQQQLSLFLQLLFESELVREGRPVLLPREFMQQVEAWKEPLPPPPPDNADEEPATEMLNFEEAARAGFGHERSDASPGAPAFPWLRALLLLVSAAAVGFGGVALWQRLQESSLEITSEPAGAEVRVDGQRLKTPVTLSRLSGDRTVRVELSLPGYEPWQQDVPLKAGQHLHVPATLSRVPPPAPPPEPEPEPEPEPPAPPPPAPDVVTWPVTGFELDASRHRLVLTQAGALTVQLDPSRTHRVTLAGKPPPLGWGFYVVSEGGATPGVFDAQPLIIKSANRLYAFHVPAQALGASRRDETKPRALSIHTEGARKAVHKSVPARLRLADSTRVTVKGLDPALTYELTPRQGTPTAVAREGGAPISRVLVGTPNGLLLAPLNEVTRIADASTFFVTVLDDAPDAESGRIAFELRVLKPVKKKRRER